MSSLLFCFSLGYLLGFWGQDLRCADPKIAHQKLLSLASQTAHRLDLSLNLQAAPILSCDCRYFRRQRRFSLEIAFGRLAPFALTIPQQIEFHVDIVLQRLSFRFCVLERKWWSIDSHGWRWTVKDDSKLLRGWRRQVGELLEASAAVPGTRMTVRLSMVLQFLL